MPNHVPSIPQRRDMEVVGVNVGDRTVDLAFSSEAEVLQRGCYEILSHAEGACDLSRLNDGGAVLNNHDWNDQVGVVVKAWIGDDHVGRATVRISMSTAGRELLQDIADGIRRHVSVSYRILAERHAGDRDGIAVVLVTRWQPFEISFVPVPADVSVGVGRSAEFRPPTLPRNRISMPALSSIIRKTLNDASAATGHEARYSGELPKELRHLGPDPKIIPAPTARSMSATLRATKLSSLFDKRGQLVRAPHGVPAGESTTVSTAILANSLVARAGANIIICPEPTRAHPVGRTGNVMVERVPTEFRVIEPARFSAIDVANEDDVPVTALPTLAASIDWNDPAVKAMAVRMEFPRSKLRRIDSEQLCEEIEASIVLGIARAADKVLLGAIDSLSLVDYAPNLAAASGLKFSDLSMLVGGAYDPAPPMGSLQGDRPFNAELCADTPGGATIIGAFNRAAVAVRDDITVHWERLGRSGAMAVTAWVSMLPRTPAPGMFWRARQAGA